MKTGDIVKCIEDGDSTFLSENKTYYLVNQNQWGNWQVKDIDTGRLSSDWYKPSRFVLAEPTQRKIDLSKRYKTRSGDKVKLHAITEDRNYPIVGVALSECGTWYNETWTIDGLFLAGCSESNGSDLVEMPDSIDIEFHGEQSSAQVFYDCSVLLKQGHKSISLTEEQFEKIAKAFESMKS